MRSFPRPSGTQRTYKLNSPRFVGSQNNGGSILEEVKLHYETKFPQFPQMRQDPFEKLNPTAMSPPSKTRIPVSLSGNPALSWNTLPRLTIGKIPLDNSLTSTELHEDEEKRKRNHMLNQRDLYPSEQSVRTTNVEHGTSFMVRGAIRTPDPCPRCVWDEAWPSPVDGLSA